MIHTYPWFIFLHSHPDSPKWGCRKTGPSPRWVRNMKIHWFQRKTQQLPNKKHGKLGDSPRKSPSFGKIPGSPRSPAISCWGVSNLVARTAPGANACDASATSRFLGGWPCFFILWLGRWIEKTLLSSKWRCKNLYLQDVVKGILKMEVNNFEPYSYVQGNDGYRGGEKW